MVLIISKNICEHILQIYQNDICHDNFHTNNENNNNDDHNDEKEFSKNIETIYIPKNDIAKLSISHNHYKYKNYIYYIKTKSDSTDITIYFHINHKKCKECQNFIKEIVNNIDDNDDDLYRKIDTLTNMISYLPLYGDEYKKTKENFETILNNNIKNKSEELNDKKN